MHKAICLLGEAGADLFKDVGRWFKKHLMGITKVLTFVCPYASMLAIIGAYVERDNKLAFGGEWLVPLIFFFVIALLKKLANRLGTGITIPTPAKRFTKIEDDGEITVAYDRSEELILYMADLEDWLQRRGLL